MERGQALAAEAAGVGAGIVGEGGEPVMSTRYATPGGVTVHQVTLSGTPKPSRPGDPANHMDARDYLVRTLPGGRDRWYCPTLDDLKDLADREAWDVADLAPMPTY